MDNYVVAIGASAGGIEALRQILGDFAEYDKVAVVVIQHLSPTTRSYMYRILSDASGRTALEVEDGMELQPGGIYVAPPDHHVLIRRNDTFALDSGEKVCYARPSIDVTFQSVAARFGTRAIGVLLTGANRDGSDGLISIRKAGGYTLVQDPETAEVKMMPAYAVEHAVPSEVRHLKEIGKRLNELVCKGIGGHCE